MYITVQRGIPQMGNATIMHDVGGYPVLKFHIVSQLRYPNTNTANLPFDL